MWTTQASQGDEFMLSPGEERGIDSQDRTRLSLGRAEGECGRVLRSEAALFWAQRGGFV